MLNKDGSWFDDFSTIAKLVKPTKSIDASLSDSDSLLCAFDRNEASGGENVKTKFFNNIDLFSLFAFQYGLWVLLVLRNLGLIQSSPRLSRPTTFSANHDGQLWDFRLYPRNHNPEDSMERVATKFETIENMIDRMQEVIVALDDKLLDLIGGLIGKLTPYETEGGPTEFYTGN